MIIQVNSAATGEAEKTRQSLDILTSSWGHPITEIPAVAAIDDPDGSKGIDFVAVATLVLSIPSAALSVMDLADRITKRRRAQELIGQAQQLTTQHVTINVIAGNNTVALSSLTPDQLLELVDGARSERNDGHPGSDRF